MTLTAPAPAASRHDLPDQDLAFTGAGVSTSYVLLALLRQAIARPPARPLRIAAVERAAEPFGGLPYGDRAARACLLITKLRDFLPDSERQLFSTWLAQQGTTAFQPFLASGGPWAARWWERHHAAIGRGEFDDLFLPRYLFGDHIAARVRQAIADAEQAGVATVAVLRDEVLSVEPVDGGYRLQGAQHAFSTSHLVLATGSAPVQPRMSQHAVPCTVVVDDPFEHLDRALGRVRDGLASTSAGRDPVVVILGANASTMDLLYQIDNLGTPEIERATFVVLSPRGELPERMDDVNPSSTFRPRCLDELAAADIVDAATVYAAAVEDIMGARAAGLPVSDTLRPISMGVSRVLPRLSPPEMLDFAGRWGAELGRHQRRAGGEYYEVVDHLAEGGRIRLVAGAFVGLGVGPAGKAVVRFEHAGVVQELGPAVDVVVNCAGPARELRQAQHFLPAQLVDSGVCATTPHGGGIAVDASFQAAPRLFVMGPLLAGNVLDGYPIWHMEHCGRISAYGTALGTSLARTLLGG